MSNKPREDGKVRRLDIVFHFEDGILGMQFDIEDFSGKLNGVRGLRAASHSSNSA
jgi:hypothetical protein